MKKFLLLAVLFLVLLNVQKVDAKQKKVLFIGDSRTYGMCKYCKNADKYYFIAEGGVGVNFISSKLKVSLGKVYPQAIVNTLTHTGSGSTIDLVKECKKHKISRIVYNLGVNGIKGYNSTYKYAIKTMKRLHKKTKARVYFTTIYPIVDSKINVGLNNLQVIRYNSLIKRKYKNYITTYKFIRRQKYSNYTSDGLHYYPYLNNKILKYIIKHL